MWDIIITDLIPIYIVMLGGYLSGKRNIFKKGVSVNFNKLVLNYCLPSALFVSIVKADRHMLFEDGRLSAISLIVIVGLYFWTFFSCKKFFKHTTVEASVSGLIGGAPTIGFLGYAVLEPIYGDTATTGLVVAIVAIVVNAIAIPICLCIMDPGQHADADETPKVVPAHATGVEADAIKAEIAKNMTADKGTPVAATATGSTVTENTASEVKKAPHHEHKVAHALWNALKEPVVWSPILAVAIVLCGIRFPPKAEPTLELIGKANAGVAVFAAGLTLAGSRIVFNWEVIYNSIVKLFLMPALFLILGRIFGMESEKLQMLVLAGALPPVFSGVIIGSRFNVYVRTGTSSLAFSTLCFAGTAPLWIWLARMLS